MLASQSRDIKHRNQTRMIVPPSAELAPVRGTRARGKRAKRVDTRSRWQSWFQWLAPNQPSNDRIIALALIVYLACWIHLTIDGADGLDAGCAHDLLAEIYSGFVSPQFVCE